MLIYHRTNIHAFNNIVRVGRVLPGLCREVQHPVHGDHRRAFWATHVPEPAQWFETREWKELLHHTSRRGPPVLVEVDVSAENDLWVADWRKFGEDVADWGNTDTLSFPTYYASMKPYEEGIDLTGYALPEVISFNPPKPDKMRLVA